MSIYYLKIMQTHVIKTLVISSHIYLFFILNGAVHFMEPGILRSHDHMDTTGFFSVTHIRYKIKSFV